jgi:exonuclease III
MKLLLWNVQGIRKSGKLTVENQITNQESDIVILTETNLLPSQEIFPSLSQESNHHCIYSSNQQRGTGVLILLNSNCKMIGCPLIDPNGRYIAISIC